MRERIGFGRCEAVWSNSVSLALMMASRLLDAVPGGSRRGEEEAAEHKSANGGAPFGWPGCEHHRHAGGGLLRHGGRPH